jgi:hypothetical protein
MCWITIGLIHPNYRIHDVGDFLENAILSHEQMHIFYIIHSKTNGLRVIFKYKLFDFCEY